MKLLEILNVAKLDFTYNDFAYNDFTLLIMT
jgi:hypothetical protein